MLIAVRTRSEVSDVPLHIQRVIAKLDGSFIDWHTLPTSRGKPDDLRVATAAPLDAALVRSFGAKLIVQRFKGHGVSPLLLFGLRGLCLLFGFGLVHCFGFGLRFERRCRRGLILRRRGCLLHRWR